MSRPRRGLPNQSYKEETDSPSPSDDSELESNLDEDSTVSITPSILSALSTLSKPLTLSGRARANAAIASDLASLVQIDTEHSKLKNQYNVIELRLKTAAHQLLEKRARISMMKRLPHECLALIFHSHVSSLRSPWTLMHVCRLWRSVALFSPCLWSGITLQPPTLHEPGENAPRHVEGKERCCNIQQLKRALIRAKGVHLDIKIECAWGPGVKHFYPKTRKVYDADLKIISKMFFTVSGSNKQIRGFESWGAEKTLTSILAQPPKLSELVSLKFHYEDEALLQAVDSQAHKLKVVEVHCGLTGTYQWPSRINTLLVDMHESGRQRIDPSQMWDNLLVHARALTSLRIHSFRLNELEVPHQTLHMPLLEHLDIKDTKGLRIHCPRLRYCHLSSSKVQVGDFNRLSPTGVSRSLHCAELITLILYGHSSLVCGNFEQVFLPSLKEVTINTHLPPSLANVDAPAIHTLDLSISGPREWPSEAFYMVWLDKKDSTLFHIDQEDPVFYLEIKTLRFCLTRLNPRILVEMLKRLTTIEELYLTGARVVGSVWKALQPSVVVDEASGLKTTAALCMGLHTIEVDMHESGVEDKTTSILKAARKTVKARMAAGFRMEKACIRFTHKRGWINLL